MSEYSDRLKGFGVGRHTGTSRTSVVSNDDKPGPAGTVTEHWDGRSDARVVNPAITVNPNLIARCTDGD